MGECGLPLLVAAILLVKYEARLPAENEDREEGGVKRLKDRREGVEKSLEGG